MPVLVGLGAPAAAAGDAAPPAAHVGMGIPDGNGTGNDAQLGRHVGMGSPDGSGTGSGGRHVGSSPGRHVGMPDGSGTGRDGRQVGTPPGKQVGNGRGVGVGSGGRQVGTPPPPDGAVDGGGVVGSDAGGVVDWPGIGRLGRVRLGSGSPGAELELDMAKVRPTGSARTTANVSTPVSRIDRFLIAPKLLRFPARPFPARPLPA